MKTAATWRRPFLLIATFLTLLLQFIHYFEADKLIGFPFNFVSYNGKFDTYSFFADRLLLSGLSMAAFIGLAYLLISHLRSKR